MKVILLEDVKGKGKKGQMIEVSDGYAKNFLISKGLATQANAANINVMKTQQAAEDARRAKELQQAKDLAEELAKVNLKMKIKAGEQGRLFGAVSNKDIGDELFKQCNIEIDKKKIILRDVIKSIGTFEIQAKLHNEVMAKFNVTIESV